ncbi:type IV toxin-antitoxin system AbiEi family antitoxin domain-containing protein [Intrasporangium sp.]|uniref:type IV toxin-antitoxin system AbiEi family antitoxin domain-containing protein n=1 Tax=Intrasporangium sp. TaxID=1925024 RepID=UPI003221E1CF
MDTRLHALAELQHGVLAARDAHARGVSDVELRTGVRERQLVRVRRGAYVARSRWEAADADERYRLRVLAVARTRPGDTVSHHAALALRGLPLWGARTDRVDLLGAVRQPVHRAGLCIHPTAGVVPEVLRGVRVCPLARALVRTALTMGRDCAVVAGDAALHGGLTRLEDL